MTTTRLGRPESRGRRVLLALVLVACSPLVVLAVLAWALYGLGLHLLLWLVWIPAGKRVLLVYSNSPVWQAYVEDTLVPRLPRNSVILNWSERRRWRWWWLSTAVFRFVGGSREFNPLAVVIRPFRRVRTFRFWRAFRDARHGDHAALRTIEAEFLRFLDVHARDAH